MSMQNSGQRITIAAVVALLIVAAVATVYVFSGQLGDQAVRLSIDIADIFAAGACAVMCFILWQASGKSERLRRVWGFLGVGMALWTVAEVIFAYYELILNQDTPTVSLADIAWVIGYIPIFIALWLRFRVLRVSLRPNEWTELLAGFAILALLSVSYVITPNLPTAEAMPEATSSFENVAALVLSVFYPLGDLLMALGAGLTIIAMMGGSISRLWLLVALGCLAIGLADSTYYVGLANGLYTSQVPMNWFTGISDLSYLVGYLMIALGLFGQATFQRAF